MKRILVVVVKWRHLSSDREVNWAELTFAETSGTVTVPVAIPETTAGRMSAPVPFLVS